MASTLDEGNPAYPALAALPGDVCEVSLVPRLIYHATNSDRGVQNAAVAVGAQVWCN
ncbi:hypothetical protein [Rhodanobacter lindaniclasticus]|uniref:hypothetical protein n=1 Tax=Rhodanobacter lindaniclasticus TaxID=75310 RepID=UPI001446D0B0|nr:hypothetical protein [Rhodanobacter lindaniclasticus]